MNKNNFEKESAFVDEIEKYFKVNGFQTWREVIPDNCEGWEFPWKVDLIVYHEKTGYIGIEAKNLNTIGQG